METCDISLVKKEIVELIKTEPQNEDEFDMCGQSGIKTEDSNLAGDFKDTINYETHSFQISDVERKSLLNGFLPIKEKIKDESDNSNSVDDIVKTEIKSYDSSFGNKDSNIDHFTSVDKYEIKLEQDQFTLSSEILHSNIITQTSCDFNSNSECVNENKNLSLNSLHKKAECRNLPLKRLSSKFHKNITTKYKTSFLNSDQTKYVKEHQGVFSDNVYKKQAFSDNLLTSKVVQDSVEINLASINPKLGEISLSTKATETKGKLERYTNKGVPCIALEGRLYKNKNCSRYPLKGGNCFLHGGGIKVRIKNCTKKGQLRGDSTVHEGGRKCKTKNCIKYSLVGGHCRAHGGGKKCKTDNCTKSARVGGYCITHGGGWKCKTENCTKSAQVGGHCIAHGGGMKCKTENCTKSALVGGRCIKHGGGRKCKTENCTKSAQVGGHCIAHGGGTKCKTENCTTSAQVGGHCIKHGGGRKCKIENCTKCAQVGGHCMVHGGVRKCKSENCTKNAQVGGHCIAHGGGRKCKTENCSKGAQAGGHCIAHGGGT